MQSLPEGIILICVNLFVTLSSFLIFYIKLIERVTKIETTLNLILDKKIIIKE